MAEKDAAPKIAIALDYDRSKPEAPRVVASGRGPVAEQILAVARANGVDVREDPDLAQILAAVDVDSEIPLEAFAAVAEILAYLYRRNGQSAKTESAQTGSTRAEPPKNED